MDMLFILYASTGILSDLCKLTFYEEKYKGF